MEASYGPVLTSARQFLAPIDRFMRHSIRRGRWRTNAQVTSQGTARFQSDSNLARGGKGHPLNFGRASVGLLGTVVDL